MGRGIWIYVSTINGVIYRGFHLSSASQKSNASSCLSCLLARPLFKQFGIKRYLLSLVQTFMIPHKAHICTAGIAHWRSGTKDLNDLTENRKRITILIFTVHKLEFKLVPLRGDFKNQFLICYNMHKKLRTSNRLKTGALFISHECKLKITCAQSNFHLTGTLVMLFFLVNY